MLPCFCKHNKCGFSCYQTFTVFWSYLARFLDGEVNFMLFLHSKTEITCHLKNPFLNFLTDFILGAQIMMSPNSVYCYHNRDEIPPPQCRKPQTHHNWILINCDMFVNLKQPRFRT